MDQGLIDLKLISVNKDNPFPARYIDIMNTWYGHPDIPLARVVNGTDDSIPVNYPQKVVEMRGREGKPLFRGSIEDYDKIPESVEAYRKLLAQLPDESAVVISIGFSTNLARLLETGPDSYSDLDGRDLVRKKVKYASVMACNLTHPDAQEYNIMKDIPAAAKFFDRWPTPIVLSPFELGEAIEFPAEVVSGVMSAYGPDPLTEGYKAYRPMPYSNAVFDMTSVLYAVEGAEGYFSLSEPGKIEVDDQGRQKFTPSAGGNVRVLLADETQQAAIKARLVELISPRPQAGK